MSIEIGGVRIAVTALIPAAGSGTRMGGGTVKQFLPLRGEPVLLHTVRLFSLCDLVDEIIIAAHDLEAVGALVGAVPKVTRIVPGGATRQESVWAALETVHARPRVVCVHDAARPLLPTPVLEHVLRGAAEHQAQVVANPVTDTIKTTDPAGFVTGTLDRSTLWAVQTPQVFWVETLVRAFRQAIAEGFSGTDCAALVERTGVPVRIHPGSSENLKLTTPEDLVLAEAILARRMQQL